MDRTQVCGTCNPGSIPGRGTTNVIIISMETAPQSQTQDNKNPLLLETINNIMNELNKEAPWLKGNLKTIPEFLPEYEKLKGKKILWIDDTANLIGKLAPHFVVATDNNFSFVLHKDQSKGGLLQEVLDKNPDIILLDYSLANGVKGDILAKILIAEDYTGKIIGFSGDGTITDHFKNAGVEAVHKDEDNPSKSLKDIANLI